MSRCVVCNRKIGVGQYFCDTCLEREVEKPFKKKKNLVSWLIFSPFQARNIVSDPWRNMGEALDWVVKSAPRVVTQFGVSLETAVDGLCDLVGVDKQAHRSGILARLQKSNDNRNGPIWAPSDLILQPASALFLLFFLSVIVYALVF